MQEHAVIVKDLSLYYKITGQGEPVMLVHGFGEDSTIFDTLIPELKKEYTLIIPDLAGSGRSTGNIEGVSMESLAEQLNLIAEKEIAGPFTMIGHSMGGYITLAFAEKYPDKLQQFALFHSTAYPDNEEKKSARKKNIEFIRKHGSHEFLKQAIPNLFSEEFKKQQPEIVKELITRYSNFSPTSLVSYTEAMMNRPDRIHVLKDFQKPVLFIFGEWDTAVPLEQGLKQCKIPEYAYIYICAHSGHLGMLEEPGFCLKAIQDFLSGK
jgi:pimeloyl-ACP methyl ester carboxylesterase